VLIGVEADDEDTVHGHEQTRQLGDAVAAVAPVQRNLKQVLERVLRLSVHVHVVACTPAVHATAVSACITRCLGRGRAGKKLTNSLRFSFAFLVF